jgi:hypothetical protein
VKNLLLLLAIIAIPVALVGQQSNAQGSIPVKSVLSSAYTNATTTFSNISGMSFSVSPNTSYTGQCYILWQGSAITTGPQFQWTGPASPTAVGSSMVSNVTTATVLSASAVGLSVAMSNAGTITTGTNMLATLFVGFVNGVNSGTLQLQAAANGTGTLTIQPGSYCVFQ